MSIISHPERGPWGDSSWRGNCSGHVYQDVFSILKPKSFIDPMVGSGTSVEVALEMNIKAVGLDLHQGFNAVRDSILEKVGEPADLVMSHPPYGSMIVYSGVQWGDAPHPDDLSRCASESEFHDKMQLVLLNQRMATVPGGYYATLIGDRRKDGRYTSYQAEMIARMPSDELVAVWIKQQHNCVSDRQNYRGLRFPRIEHEYILVWQKKSRAVLSLLGTLAREQYSRLTGTWKNIVRTVLMQLGGSASLASIYEAMTASAPDKVAANEHWRDKVRQVLNQSPTLFRSKERGVWALA